MRVRRFQYLCENFNGSRLDNSDGKP